MSKADEITTNITSNASKIPANEIFSIIPKQKGTDSQSSLRKDGKGIPIVKKVPNKKIKSKYHAYWKDEIQTGKEVANIVDIKSYKKYNRDDSIIESEEEQEEGGGVQGDKEVQVEEDLKLINGHRCCIIF